MTEQLSTQYLFVHLAQPSASMIESQVGSVGRISHVLRPKEASKICLSDFIFLFFPVTTAVGRLPALILVQAVVDPIKNQVVAYSRTSCCITFRESLQSVVTPSVSTCVLDGSKPGIVSLGINEQCCQPDN